jgi:hypothetical protein
VIGQVKATIARVAQRIEGLMAAEMSKKAAPSRRLG